MTEVRSDNRVVAELAAPNLVWRYLMHGEFPVNAFAVGVRRGAGNELA